MNEGANESIYIHIHVYIYTQYLYIYLVHKYVEIK